MKTSSSPSAIIFSVVLFIFSFGIFLLSFSSASAQERALHWGAIAYSKGGATGIAVDHASSDEARAAALAGCGTDCVSFTFADSCGAVAFSTDGANASGTGTTEYGAKHEALRRCGGEDPYIKIWQCTTRPRHRWGR
jgi:hypothetical protein